MSLTNRFQAAHDNVRVIPPKTLDLFADKTLSGSPEALPDALNDDQAIDDTADLVADAGAETEIDPHEPVDMFALDRAPETSEQRWRRIAGQIYNGGSGIWGNAEERRKTELKESEARSAATQRVMIQINQRIERSFQETERSIQVGQQAGKHAVEQSSKNVREADELVEDGLDHAIVLSNGKKRFLSKDKSRLIDEDGNDVSDKNELEEARKKYESNPDRYITAEEYKERKKLQRAAHENHEESLNGAKDMDKIEQDHNDLKNQERNAKTPEEREAIAKKGEQESPKANDAANDNARNGSTADEIGREIDKLKSQAKSENLPTERLEDFNTKKTQISQSVVPKLSFSSAALAAAQEARSTGTVAQEIAPIKLSENVPPVKTEFAKNAAGETVAVTTDTPKPSNDQPIQTAATTVVSQSATAAPV